MSLTTSHTALHKRLVNLGTFDKVADHEPASPPGKGLYAAMWFERIRPVPEMSSLSHAAMLYVHIVRIYKNATSEPKDSIDIGVIEAADAVFGSLAEDHTLGSTAYAVDILGAYSDGLTAETDYVDFGRNQWFRVVDLSIPVVVDGVHSYAG